MERSALYPLKLRPSLHVKVWGGRRLAEVLNKNLPTDEPYGESWELHDSAVVDNGPLAGQTLSDVLATYGHDLVGVQNNPAEGFPLLAKFIDAAEWLSVQVHPNDKQAQLLEGDPRGKTEAWIILDTRPDSQLVIGLRPGTSAEQMARAIEDNSLEALLMYARVRGGDVLYMPANTVHALGPGILLYEIQQSSDITYRLYDWGRVGLDGQPRPLHIEKGVTVANLNTLPQITHPMGDSATVVAGAYFRTVRHELQGTAIQLETEGDFHALTCIAGELTVSSGGHEFTLSTGDTGLIPAAVPDYSISGTGVMLRSYQNNRE